MDRAGVGLDANDAVAIPQEPARRRAGAELAAQRLERVQIGFRGADRVGVAAIGLVDDRGDAVRVEIGQALGKARPLAPLVDYAERPLHRDVRLGPVEHLPREKEAIAGPDEAGVAPELVLGAGEHADARAGKPH